MSIKQHLSNALANIKADKERSIAVAKETAMRETVAPKHAEINKARDEAIASITAKHNQKIAELQHAFAAEKQELVDAGEKKKNEFACSAIECAIATVNVQYEKAIFALEEQISKIEE